MQYVIVVSRLIISLATYVSSSKLFQIVVQLKDDITSDSKYVFAYQKQEEKCLKKHKKQQCFSKAGQLCSCITKTSFY